jgi:hypothetical protein
LELPSLGSRLISWFPRRLRLERLEETDQGLWVSHGYSYKSVYSNDV